MKLTDYLKDKNLYLLIYLVNLSFIILLLITFKIQKELIVIISLMLLFMGLSIILLDYQKKKKYYDTILNNFKSLDKKTLISELIYKPNFIEGQILYDLVYDVDKYCNEKIKKHDLVLNDFKDYIEMWIHEVKIPLAGLYLIIHNEKNKKLSIQASKIENELDQVLYYVRSENSSKDYLIRETNLKSVIKNVALKNKDYLLNSNIELNIENINEIVLTDSKWLEFIINQIISNSIKYKRNIKDSYIKISTTSSEETISLIIEDNGIGINQSDLPRVFEKTYTGTNGRKISSSTGMGLYIVKSLCNKLGHKIEIVSIENNYTKVTITFNRKSIYDVVK